MREDGDDFFALPGGSVEEGEFSQDALRREIGEELGCAATVGPLRFVCENLFRWRGRRYQQIVLLFEATLEQNAILLRDGEFRGREAHLHLAWASRADLARFDIRPSALLELLEPASTLAPILPILHRQIRDDDF